MVIIVNKNLHKFIIFFGTIFILIGAFHTNLWVDESYSIALANHSFIDIWKIGAIDVHPILYYWMLRIIILITNLFNNTKLVIITLKLFSSLATIILGIIGYTHIRKDFSEKVGIIFSFLVLFMPTQIIYSQEIRMYTWLMLFVTLTSIYAYRYLKNNDKKHQILFVVFSLLSSYTHYYGLMASVLINIILGINLFIEMHKNKNSIFIKKYKYFIFYAIIQIILYLPWTPYLLNQTDTVSNGFWVSFEFPKTIIETFEFQFTCNNIDKWIYINPIIGNLFGIFFILYSMYIFLKKKNKNDNFVFSFSILIYILVLIIAIILSFKTPILYPRYILSISGLLYLFIAYSLSKSNNKFVLALIFIMIVIFESIVNIKNIKTNYNQSNMKQIEYVEKSINEDDIIVYSSIDLGSTFSVHFPENRQYLYNIKKWQIDSYKIYEPIVKRVYTYDFLKDYTGTIWLIDGVNCEFYQDFIKNVDVTQLEVREFNTEYKNYKYTVFKLLKNN